VPPVGGWPRVDPLTPEQYDALGDEWPDIEMPALPDPEDDPRGRERRLRTTAERLAQGLPPMIIDPVALDRVAQILLHHEARIEAEKKAARRAARTRKAGS
jgi:hypothetical protein